MHGGSGSAEKRLSFFERYLSLWVALCIVAGVLIGSAAPGLVGGLSRLEVSQVNLPIAVLIWLMICPMMLRIDFAALRGVGQRPKGLLVVLFVNWLVKPFSMALLAWVFIRNLFAPLLPAGQIDSYIAGLILLAAAPCTAMVFVWTWVVGDILNDVEAGSRAGCRTVLIDNGNETEWDLTPLRPPGYIVKNLFEAALIITRKGLVERNLRHGEKEYGSA